MRWGRAVGALWNGKWGGGKSGWDTHCIVMAVKGEEEGERVGDRKGSRGLRNALGVRVRFEKVTGGQAAFLGACKG